MAIDQDKKEGDINKEIKSDEQKKALETEHPIGERDEVKKAESRTQDLQNNASKPDSEKND